MQRAVVNDFVSCLNTLLIASMFIVSMKTIPCKMVLVSCKGQRKTLVTFPLFVDYWHVNRPKHLLFKSDLSL